ncbi:hypothetical protein OSB04_001649 [Centaurea solstitialis]|uniref:CCHC-type domain-containing protein n=1 Tax=Centaurea solstitialis TaxID=347529 RepID=A0AA38TYX3_9ASTR|nr:hypothetical protein OSB04_001649 [Centaurea solstitialis]
MGDNQPLTRADIETLVVAISTALGTIINAANDCLADRLTTLINGRPERVTHPDRRPLPHHQQTPSADIPYFHGNIGVEEFFDWQIEVDRFFEIMEIPDHKQVKMVAFRLKSTVGVWWDCLTTQRQRQLKGLVRSWRRMKQLMSDRFLPGDYEQILYRMYLECAQGKTEGQRVVRYINSLKPSIQEKIKLQTAWTVSEACNLAMKAELIEKYTQSSYRRYTTQTSTNASSSNPNKGKRVITRPTPKDSDPPRTTTAAKPPVPKLVNPYAKPSAPKCYRCGLSGHKSNECTNQRTVGLVEGEEHGEENEEYEGPNFAEEDFEEENVNIVLQRVFLAPKEDGQRKNLFRSYCSINKKICNLIVDNRSCENLVAQKLVDHLGLPTQPHESPYGLGWVKKGPKAQVTQVCKVPLSIGNYYKEDVLCDVLDMDACHILLGRPWQYDNNATHKGRDNVMLFR